MFLLLASILLVLLTPGTDAQGCQGGSKYLQFPTMCLLALVVLFIRALAEKARSLVTGKPFGPSIMFVDKARVSFSVPSMKGRWSGFSPKWHFTEEAFHRSGISPNALIRRPFTERPFHRKGGFSPTA
jgi:hypothetical protein